MRNLTLRRVAAASTVSVALAGAAVALVLTGAPDAHGSHGGKPATESTQESVGAQSLRTSRFRILNATGQPLTLTSKRQDGSWREEPGDIGLLRVGDYTVEANDADASGWLTYTIGDAGITVKIEGENPIFGSNLHGCFFETADTAYTCRMNQDQRGYNDTNYNIVVEPKAAETHRIDVNDPVARAAAMEVACGSAGIDYTGCDVARVEDVTQTLSPPKALGQKVVNCGDEGTGGGTWRSVSDTSGTSWSIGVSTGFTFGPEGAKLAMKAFLGHEWASSHTTTTQYRLSVPAGYYGWMERAAPMESIRADYDIQIGNQKYEIPAVTVTTPATGDLANGMAIARTVKIPESSAICSGRNEPFPLPIPTNPTLGHTFRIGLNGANTRVIAAGDAADVPPTLAKSDTGARRQQWRFDELPGSEGYFLIRNVEDPERCLDQHVAPQAVIVHKCKDGSESDVANQLWSVVFDPDTSAYRLVSKINGRAVVAGGDAVGSKIGVSDSAGAELGRWEFSPVG